MFVANLYLQVNRPYFTGFYIADIEQYWLVLMSLLQGEILGVTLSDFSAAVTADTAGDQVYDVCEQFRLERK